MTTLTLLTVVLLALAATTAHAARKPPRVIGEPAHAAKWSNHVNQALIRIARCETGGKTGQNGKPDWDHQARSEHPGLYYWGALGFLETTWEHYRHRVRPLPPDAAWKATPAEQLAVGRVLVAEFSGYSSWPACSRRIGLR